jgi:hypothetical protein
MTIRVANSEIHIHVRSDAISVSLMFCCPQMKLKDAELVMK